MVSALGRCSAFGFVLALAVATGCNPGETRPDGGAPDADAAVDANGDDAGDAGQGDDGAAADGADAVTDGDAVDDAGLDDGDAGGADEGDAGEVFALELDPLQGWQRGPVRLGFVAFGPRGRLGDVAVAWSSDGVAFEPATALSGYQDEARGLDLDPQGAAGRFVWDSKANLNDSQDQIWLRASLRVGGQVEAFGLLGPFELDDRPERDRVVVVAHPYDTDANGEPVEGSRASALTLLPDGGLVDTGLDLDCGSAPELAAFTADGRHLVVLGEGPGHNQHNLASFSVGPDGGLTPSGPVIELYDLGLSASQLVPAPDGSGLWLVHYTGEGGLFFLSFEGAAPGLVEADGGGYHLLPITLPTAMSIRPDNRTALLSGGALVIDDPPYDASLVDLPAGTILDQAVIGLDELSEGVAVNAGGDLALMPSGDYGDGGQLWAVALSADTLGAGQAVTVPAPAKVVFHPVADVALMTSWYPGAVLVVDVRTGAPVISQTFSGLGLADYIDCVREGSLAGLCFVSTTSASTGISSLAPVWLATDGSASLLGLFDFGDGYEAIVAGVAVQP